MARPMSMRRFNVGRLMSEMAIEGAVTGNTPGAQLQAARQGMGWTVEQVAEQLKWAPRQVLALEAGDYQALPGMATVRGFLRAYAKLVKLDPAPLVAQYDQQNGTAADVLPVRRELATPFSEVRLPSMHKRGLSPASWAVIGALVLLVCVLVASHMGWLKPLPADLFGRKPGPLTSQTAVASNSSASANQTPVSPAPTMSSALPPEANASNNAASNVESAVANSAANNVANNVATTAANAALNSSATANTTAGPSPVQSVTTALPVGMPRPAEPVAQVNSRAPGTTPAPAGTRVPGATQTPVVLPTPTVTPTPAANGVTATGNPATGTGGALVLKFRQDCWVEVKRVNGNVLLSRLLKAGETETVPMNDPVQLVVGNVAGVDATLRGQPLVLKNAAGNTARVILK